MRLDLRRELRPRSLQRVSTYCVGAVSWRCVLTYDITREILQNNRRLGGFQRARGDEIKVTGKSGERPREREIKQRGLREESHRASTGTFDPDLNISS